MKRLIKLLLVLIAVHLTFSCQKDPIEGTPEIRLSEDVVNVTAPGGKYSVTYSIINPVQGQKVSADTDADWIKTVDVNKPNVVTLDIASNADTISRTATVVLRYSSECTAELKVVQSPGEEVPEDVAPFEIRVENTDIETAVVKYTPADSDAGYLAMCISSEEYDKLGSDDAVVKEIVSMCWKMATSYGLSISDYMQTSLTIGEKRLTINGLVPDTEYRALAVGMTVEAEPTTELVMSGFSTLPIEMNGATFDISYEIGRPNVTMTVVPSSNDYYYYYDVIRKSDAENMDMTLEESLKEFFDSQIQYGIEVIGITREEMMIDFLTKGTSSMEYTNLHASTKYLGIAVSVTLQGYLNSEMTIKEFETEGIEMSDNQLGLELPYVGVDCVTINITTTNSDPYCMLVMETSTWPELSPEEYLEKLEGNYALDTHVASGNKSGTMRGLSANTEYYVLLFGYSNGRATTDLVYEVFTTREEGNPEILTFETNFSNVLSNSLSVELLPTPDNALYTATLIESSFSADDVYEYINQTAEMYIGAGMVASLEDFLLQISVRGPQTTDFDKLYSETEYKMFAIGVYPDTGKYATDVYFSQSVKTEARTVSDVTINLHADNYFDGDEVAAEYPEHSGAKGQAVMIVRADVTGDVDKYYYHMFYNDLSDPVSTPDDALIMELTTPFGGLSVPETVFYCTYGKVYTLVAVAKDRNGNFGEVFRKVVVCEEDGCSPIDEFNPSQTRRTDARNYVHRIKGDLVLKAHDTAVSLWNGPMDSASASLKPQEADEPQLWLRMAERTQMMSAGAKKSTSGKSIVFVK